MAWTQCWEYCLNEPNRRMVIVRDADKQTAVMDYLTNRNNNSMCLVLNEYQFLN